VAMTNLPAIRRGAKRVRRRPAPRGQASTPRAGELS